MVLMLMELLASNAQCVADFAADYQQYNFVAFNIIQHAEVSDAKFKFGKWVLAKSLYGPGWRCGLVCEPRLNCCLQSTLLACRQGDKLPLSVGRDGYLISHSVMVMAKGQRQNKRIPPTTIIS
jgi:hypothetical protein